MNHARCSPSAYRKWSTCPGSLTLEKKLGDLLPDDEGSDAANLGTQLHSTAEQALKGECEPCEATQFYVDYCRDAAAADDAEMIVEALVPLFYSREEHGYADCVVRTDKVVHIIDLKTGCIPVNAVDNWQLLIYAYGMGLLSTETFKMTIIQNDEAKTWTVSAEQADALASVIGVKAQAAMNDYIHELAASDDACRWCPCKAYCPAFTESLLENFEDITTDMKKLNDQKLAHLFAHKAQITKTLNEIEKALFHRIDSGDHIDGLHIEQGRRGNKTWSKDVNPIEAMLTAGVPADQAVVTKPITPTQALKLSPDVDGWYQPEGRPMLKAGDVVCPSHDFDVIE